jgi:MFS superfamily sulfate permease-like transporter
VFASLQGYRRVWIRADVIAGLTVWAVLVPEALAYATIAGVPPAVGLYAAVPSLVLYAGGRQLTTPGGRTDVGDRGAVRGQRRALRRW